MAYLPICKAGMFSLFQKLLFMTLTNWWRNWTSSNVS